MKLTNQHKIGLSWAVFLAHDSYDYDPRPNAISATGLLKSTRQAILSRRAEAGITTMDVSQLASSSFGTAMHDAVEQAWKNENYKRAMLKLGYPQKQIDRIRVNPTTVEPDTIPIYMEKRSEREVDGVIISGKFDFVGDGELEDHKTTGVFTYIQGTNNEKYRLQGSIYKWLNPDIITSDRMLINYMFTDWSALRAKIEIDKGYPQHKMMSVPISLMTIEETDQWVKGKIREIKANINKLEVDLPYCTSEELWQSDAEYKYYKNPASKTRSTKNFSSFAEAHSRLLEDGSVGVIDIVPGKAKACIYCPAAIICSQAKGLVIDGLLDMEL